MVRDIYLTSSLTGRSEPWQGADAGRCFCLSVNISKVAKSFFVVLYFSFLEQFSAVSNTFILIYHNFITNSNHHKTITEDTISNTRCNGKPIESNLVTDGGFFFNFFWKRPLTNRTKMTSGVVVRDAVSALSGPADGPELPEHGESSSPFCLGAHARVHGRMTAR